MMKGEKCPEGGWSGNGLGCAATIVPPAPSPRILLTELTPSTLISPCWELVVVLGTRFSISVFSVPHPRELPDPRSARAGLLRPSA